LEVRASWRSGTLGGQGLLKVRASWRSGALGGQGAWRSGAPGGHRPRGCTRRLEVGGGGQRLQGVSGFIISFHQGFNGLVSLRFQIARGSRGFRWPRGRWLQEDTDSRLGQWSGFLKLQQGK
jgi:hypothetical protein